MDYTVKEHRERLAEPMLREEPACFIVSLGSDLFHRLVMDQFIIDAFEVMNKCPEHHFEIATKRIDRAITMIPFLTWSDNIMIGTAIESEDHKYRLKQLKQIPTENRFISFAPLLGDVGELDLTGIKMVGAYGEDWELKRPYDPEWIANIRRQAFEQNVKWINTSVIYDKEAA